jgi:retron-type reverse transcriptase
MGMERRGCVKLLNQFTTRKEEDTLSKTKPHIISKHLVMEAYQRVKANKGAAGVDRQSLESFELNLKDNLYKIWNRMSYNWLLV